MALNAYLTLRGARQGVMQGSVTQKGREGQIAIIAVSHEVVSPRDPASGLPTGRRQHKPFVLTKELDVSSPKLAAALADNENLTSFVLRFWRPTLVGGVAGAEQQYYTVTLTNANVASIRVEMLNNKYPENTNLAVREHVAFTYQRIEWTWMDGGITSQDDWESPAQ